MLPSFHGNEEGSDRRARPDRRPHGEAHLRRAQGRRRSPRHLARRPARGARAPRVRRQGPVQPRDAQEDWRAPRRVRPRSPRRRQPPPEGTEMMATAAVTTPRTLVERFEACTLQPWAFGHREHLLVAWTYLRAAPFEVAAMR